MPDLQRYPLNLWLFTEYRDMTVNISNIFRILVKVECMLAYSMNSTQLYCVNLAHLYSVNLIQLYCVNSTHLYSVNLTQLYCVNSTKLYSVNLCRVWNQLSWR